MGLCIQKKNKPRHGHYGRSAFVLLALLAIETTTGDGYAVTDWAEPEPWVISENKMLYYQMEDLDVRIEQLSEYRR